MQKNKMPHRITIHPHNDLLNLANFNLEIINKNLKNNEHEGLMLHCMNCIISISFGIEAFINYIGNEKLESWNERANWYAKVKQVCHASGLEYDLANPPLSTMEIMKNIRNDLAHGKSVEKEVEIRNSAELKVEMAPPWEQHCNPNFSNMAYEHANQFIKEVSERFGVALFDSLTKGVGEYGIA